MMAWPLWSVAASAPVILQGPDAKPVRREDLMAVMRSADVLILGEVHENPEHHRLRGELIGAIAHPRITVLAEHLDAGAKVDFSAGVLTGLERAGFHAKSWQWPMHEPLFDAISKSGLALLGANLPQALTSSVYASGWSALPDGIRETLERSTLSDAGQRALSQELFEGHCGMLAREALPKMMHVQRARDAYMAYEAWMHAPSVLVAGNGHAWRLVGVPQVIAAMAPQAKVVSVMFVEGPPKDLSAADYFWVTPVVSRPDPCEVFHRSPKG